MSKALYRKYRSTSLDTIVGQDHITSLLRRHIDSDTVTHAYLLTGPRGVGKTSIARIIAHEINQLPYDGSSHLDIIEIDAASNNGVEDVRDLREKVHIAPASASKKVYIIDEVHMLSRQAFNALLKTLEEPPAHAVFILATTDAEKLPATILSRVQRYNFRSITMDDAVRHLKDIARTESIKIDEQALELIAEQGGGSFRDSIGLLDQLRHLADGETLTRREVEKSIGLGEASEIDKLIESYRAQNIKAMATSIQAFEQSGTQAATVASQLIKSLTSTLNQHPEDAASLEAMLEVHQSTYPYIKLLTALVSQPAKQAKPTSSTVATQSTARDTAKPTAKSATNSPKTPAPAKVKKAVKADQKAQPLIANEFDWQKLLASAKKQSTGLHTLLNKAGYQLADSSLIIYAGNGFSAKRIESSAKLAELGAALEENGWSSLEITIKPTTKPPSDSRAASVAAIMGGGEEVEINGE